MVGQWSLMLVLKSRIFKTVSSLFVIVLVAQQTNCNPYFLLGDGRLTGARMRLFVWVYVCINSYCSV